MGERVFVKISRLDGSVIWAGFSDDVEFGPTPAPGASPSEVRLTVPVPLEPVPDLPFVRIPREEDPE